MTCGVTTARAGRALPPPLFFCETMETSIALPTASMRYAECCVFLLAVSCVVLLRQELWNMELPSL